MQQLTGFIKEVLVNGTENGDYVFRVVDEGGNYWVVACGIEGEEGDRLEAEGEEVNHPQLGRAMVPDSCSITPAVSADRIVAILCSGNISGIGKGTATKIVEAFGPRKAIQVIETDVQALAAVKGVGPKRAQIICEGWKKYKDSDLASGIIALQRMGVPKWMARRIVKFYLGKAVEIVRNYPYRLCRDISGIGFKGADEIALSMGVKRDSPVRIDAALKFVLDTATATGDCGILQGKLISKTSTELDVDQDLCREILGKKLADPADKDMVLHGAYVFSRKLASAEESIAVELKRLSIGRPSWLKNETDEEIHELIRQAEKDLDVPLAIQQRQAVFLALTRCVSILTGGPGTGKTKTLQVVIYVLQNWPGRKSAPINIAIAAPTGKAANRASEVVGIPASTVHRMLGLRGGEDDESEFVLSADLCVVDEYSMMDVMLSSSMLKAIGGQTALMMVGDVDQLESVGSGKVLRDAIDSGVLPVTRLTDIFRQAAGSLIIRNAHRVNRGEWLEPSKATDDCFFIPVEGNPGEESASVAMRIADTVCDLVTRRLPAHYGFDPMSDIQVLSPMNKGHCGVIELNQRLQAILNPAGEHCIRKGDVQFGSGDKIIQTRNNYDLNIFNGDVGYIRDINLQRRQFHSIFGSMLAGMDAQVLKSGAPTYRELMEMGLQHCLEMSMDDIDDIRLAYDMSIHKSQGSESPAVIIPMTMQHFVMLQRNLLYTGMTRARKLLVITGQRRAVEAAIANTRSTRRITRLKELLVKEFAA